MIEQLANVTTASLLGSVVETTGQTAAVADFPAPIGAVVSVDRGAGESVEGEVVGFRDHATLVVPLGGMAGIRRGSRVSLLRTRRTIRVGPELLGRVVDAHGQPIDGRPAAWLSERIPLDREAPVSTDRPRIETVLPTGIKAIDGLLTCGRGQRLGIFAGSGVGKSVLLGMMTRHTAADVIVIGLIGERGREVNEFIERDLGPEALRRSTIVVATSNESPLRRIQAAYTATGIAEYFRDSGKHVLLLMDSVTRFAMSQREIGLAAGEPPTTRGYPPSVFSVLPRLVERAGCHGSGSITAFYSVLVEGDDPREPVSDTVRGLLDGHVLLSRKLSSRGHYPAIDILESVSRVMTGIVSREHYEASRILRLMLATYREHEDLINIGAYRRGSNPQIDAAIDARAAIESFLQQRADEHMTIAEITNQVLSIATNCQRNAISASTAASPPTTGKPAR